MSKLTESGDLYEGNFGDWNSRLEAWICFTYSRRCFDLPDVLVYLDDHELSEMATRIRLTTTKTMLNRVPTEQRKDCMKLYRALENLAKPFALLKLPAELRNNIYEMVLPEVHWVNDTNDDMRDPYDVTRQAYPPLLHTSSQVRRETIPLFYSTTDFRFAFAYTSRAAFFAESAIVESWSATLVKDNLKHLRHVKLWICAKFILIIEFKENCGLSFERYIDSWPLEGYDGLLSEHRQVCEAARKALGLKGEAIVMALLSNWTLWWIMRSDIRHLD